jgi:acyl carrier protein
VSIEYKDTVEKYLEELIDYPINKVSNDKPLLNYGLSSIKFAQLANFVYDNFSIEIDPSYMSTINLNDIRSMKKKSTSVPISYSMFNVSKSLESIWFQSEIMHNDYYSLDFMFTVEKFQKDKFEKCINLLMDRHPVLKTGYYKKATDIYGFVKNDAKLKIKEIEVNYDEKNIASIVKKETDLKIRLDEPPLIKIIYLKSNKKDYLLFRIHHIITDFWSLSLLFKDLTDLYSGKEIAVSDQGFFENQKSLMDFQIENLHEKKIVEYLNKIKPIELDIKNYHQGKGTELVKSGIDFELYDKVKKLCEKETVSENIVFLSVFIILLSRYSHERNISLFIPYHGRSPENYKSQGNFVQLIPICFQLKEEYGFIEITKKVNAEFLNIVSRLSANKGAIYNHLVGKKDNVRPNILFAYRNSPLIDAQQNIINKELKLGDTILRIEKREVMEKKTIYDLDFLLEPGTKQLDFWIKYNSSLFERQDIKRFLDHYILLLNKLITFPTNLVSKINLLNNEQNRNITKQMKKDYDYYFLDNKTVKSEMIKSFTKNSARIAVDYSNKNISYKTLYKDANKLASILKKI